MQNANLLRLALILSIVALPASSSAKSLIDYFQPTPIACPLTTNTWGASSSVPRDTCNGVEDTKKPPQWIYWDGKIIRGADGKYHMLASRWAGSAGHGGWFNSQSILAVSESSPLGPYVDKGLAYTNGPDSGDRSKGHNVSGCELPDGTYCLIVSETVPFTIFTATSLDGPWANKGHATIDTNGVQISIPPPGDQHLESNVSLVVRPDGNFEIVQRHGIIALSTTGLLGPYKVQKPTTKYSAEETPPSNLPTVFPNRKKHLDALAPQSVENTYVYAEDPVIWYSGGQYHVLYNYPDDRVAYHLTSPDGIHDWTDRGLAYDPRMAKQLFSNTDGTVVSWYKMERPGVLMADGHVTHFSFSVTDVDKGQISGGSNHGNKVVVLAFDGVAFDAEMGNGSADGGAGGSGGGSGGTGGRGGAGGAGAGGAAGSAGSDASAGGAGGGSAAGGAGGNSSLGGSAGGASSAGGTAAGGTTGSGGRSGAGGASSGSGGKTAAAGGSAGASSAGGAHGGATTATGNNSGCSCSVGDVHANPMLGRGLGLIAIVGVLYARRRRRRV